VQQDDFVDWSCLHRHSYVDARSVGKSAKLAQKVHAFRGTAVERNLRRGRMKEQQLGVMAPGKRQRLREYCSISIVNRHGT
jgi:hypothetical protein